MNNGNLPENSRENEILSAEDEKLRLMLGSLKRVNAPETFAFSLKGKIAGAQARPSKSSILWPVLRYAVPFCLLILFAGFVVFNLFLASDNADVTQVPEIPNSLPKTQTIAESSPSIGLPLIASPASNLKKEIAGITDQSKKTVAGNSKAAGDKRGGNAGPGKDESGEPGGFRDEASTGVKSIRPKGINPDRQVAAPENVISRKPLYVSEILRQIGIETDADWHIQTVKRDSIASRSGVQIGDVIEAIDDQKLTTDTVFTEAFSGKTLHLLRSGRKISAELGKP